jgi:uncharacterized protein
VDEQVIYIALLTLVASGFGTVAGFGASTIMIPVLLLFYGLPETLLLTVIIHWFSSIWNMLLFREDIIWRLIFLFGVPGAITGVVGAWFTMILPKAVMFRAIGCLLLIYAILIIIRPRAKFCTTAHAAVACGASSGFLAGSVGISGVVRSAFLSAFDLKKEAYIAVGGGVAFLVDSTRIATYLLGGTHLGPALLYGLVIFVPASFLGAMLGRMVLSRLPQEKFRAFVVGLLSLVGLKLVAFP